MTLSAAWGRRTLLAPVLLTLAVAPSGCGGGTHEEGGPTVNRADVEEAIRDEYEQELRADPAVIDAGSYNVRVSTVDCVMNGDSEAKCVAEVNGILRGRATIDVTIDGDRYLWETDGGTVVPNPDGA